ncbi:pyridoxamine 5'-phosphate oxidase family protein [Massilia sp. TWP1-3-3]|uniref:pyridoxamine 5'-phosphate oxidase family protein n=1 Tax=Massilia sp. TWP1-3-3 TaxID=2804573 RepID=UPI003CF9F61D
MIDAPFHAGELQAQQLAGQAPARHGINEFMTEQHRLSFEALPFVLLASAAHEGSPRAQVLYGAPGFIHSPDPQTLEVACNCQLAAGAQVGLLGIDFATRRRNRANRVVRSNALGKLVIEVRESFGNCPKYITPRTVQTAPRLPLAPIAFEGLSEAARALVAASDTFFVASSGAGHGLDISHRGGPPGFVHIQGDTEGDSLVIADFSGNRYFNTFGNLLLDARAALLFIDFASGDVLTPAGTVVIAWEENARSWRFRCTQGLLAPAALPFCWH